MAGHETGSLGMGCNKLGSAAAGLSGAAVRDLIRAAVDDGVTFFDTADVYGNGTSEQLLGAALRGQRHNVRIATKGGYQFVERSWAQQKARTFAAPTVRRLRARRGGDAAATAPAAAYTSQNFDPAVLDSALTASLRRLGTDYVDVYQLHGPRRDHITDFAGFVERTRRDGRVRSFGVGLNSIEHAWEWIAVPGVDVIQLPVGLLDPDAADALIPAATSAGIRVMTRGIFGAGLLSPNRSPNDLPTMTEKWPVIADIHKLGQEYGVSALQLAAWYVRDRAPQAQWIIGINSLRQLNDTVSMFSSPMPAHDVLAGLRSVIDRYPELLRNDPETTSE